MTMVEITAIIATGILCVLCIICIAAVLRNERQANENSKAIKDIEVNLSSFGDSIKEQTGQLIEQMEKYQCDGTNERRLELLEEEIRQLAKAGEEVPAEPAPEEPVAEEPAAEDVAAVEELVEIEEIEELDDEIELDDLFRELNAMTAEKQAQPIPEVTPQIPPQAPPQMPPQTPVQPEPIQPELVQVISQPVQPQPEPPQEEPRRVTRYHQGYNVGRSGRKYTAEELNVLIRE